MYARKYLEFFFNIYKYMCETLKRISHFDFKQRSSRHAEGLWGLWGRCQSTTLDRQPHSSSSWG